MILELVWRLYIVMFSKSKALISSKLIYRLSKIGTIIYIYVCI